MHRGFGMSGKDRHRKRNRPKRDVPPGWLLVQLHDGEARQRKPDDGVGHRLALPRGEESTEREQDRGGDGSGRRASRAANKHGCKQYHEEPSDDDTERPRNRKRQEIKKR